MGIAVNSRLSWTGLLMQHGVSIQDGSEGVFACGSHNIVCSRPDRSAPHEPCYSPMAPEYPEAHALARFEAVHRNALSTPYHLPIPFEHDGGCSSESASLLMGVGNGPLRGHRTD